MVDDAIRQAVEELECSAELRACGYEAFPFDALLPRIEPAQVLIPAAEPGMRPCSEWTPADGVEVPIYAAGLLIGRFVCVPVEETCGVRLSRALRARALELAARVGQASRVQVPASNGPRPI